MLRAAHAEGRGVDGDATLSGEMFSDVSQTFQHYNWDWAGGVTTPAEFEVFRHVFPRYRAGFLVDRSKHWLIEALVRGMMINFLPDGGEGLIERDEQFSALVKILARYRLQYARFFEEGEYLGSGPIRGTFPVAALYRHEEEYL